MTASRMHRWTLATMAGLAGAGCSFDPERIAFVDSRLSPRIRPDGQALDPAQRPGAPVTDPAYWREPDARWLNDGGSQGEELATRFAPELMSKQSVSSYRNARCFWMAHEDPFRLRWESVVEVDTDGQLSALHEVMGACTAPLNRGPNPFERTHPNDLGSDHDYEDWVPEHPVPVSLTRLSSGFATDRFTQCSGYAGEGEREVGDGRSGECKASPEGIRPGCMIRGCALEVPEDTTYLIRSGLWQDVSLDVEDPSRSRLDGLDWDDWELASPHLKTVRRARTVARRMTLDPNRPGHVYTWETPTLSDGRWEENYNPTLLVHRARIFVRRGEHHHYVAPDRFLIEDATTAKLVRGCHPRVERYDETLGLLRSCYDDGLPIELTPTYSHELPRNKLRWVVRFDDDPLGEGGGEHGGEVEVPHGEMYIEWIVAEQGVRSADALYVSPRRLDFGDVMVGGRKSNLVTLENLTGDRIRIDVLRLAKASSPFSLRSSTGALPSGLGPRETAVLELRAGPSGPGDLEDFLIVQGTNLRTGERLEAQTRLLGTARAGPMLHVAPSRLIELPHYTGANRTAFLVVNSGQFAAQREPIRIEDARAGSGHARFFKVTPHPMDPGARPDQPETIARGHSTAFWLELVPGGSGTMSAELVVPVVTASGGTTEVRVPVEGRFP